MIKENSTKINNNMFSQINQFNQTHNYVIAI